MTDENNVTTEVEGLIIKRVQEYCDEWSIAQNKIADQKLLQKAGLEALCKEFESLDKKTVKKLAKTRHADNFKQVAEADETFHTEYTKIFGVQSDV